MREPMKLYCSSVWFSLGVQFGSCACSEIIATNGPISPQSTAGVGLPHCTVADLGMAQKVLGDAAIPEFVGTPGYIAPELTFEGEQTTVASPRSDVYSLGCITFELLTGHAPFDAVTDIELMALHATAKVPPPTTLRHDLPQALDEVLLNALAKEPEHRTASAA